MKQRAIIFKLNQGCGLNIAEFDPNSLDVNSLTSIILKLGIFIVGTSTLE